MMGAVMNRLMALMLAWLALAGAAIFGMGAARAQEQAQTQAQAEMNPLKKDEVGIIADLSTHTVAIRTDFAGTRVLLFGALIKSREEGKALPGIIVVVHGPEHPFKLRRKQRIAGIWVNTNERTFPKAPAYYALLSNMPLKEIATPEALKASGICFEVLKERLAASGLGFKDEKEAEEYAEAFIRMQRKRRLFQLDEKGVRMTGRYLFRAQFDLPANVPLGDYKAEVFLFRDGVFIGRYASPMRIEKRGFERVVYEFAHQQPLYYGIVAVILAIAAGFAAAQVFRKS
jgi:uncharacterized protein (TIGR02186 family)